MAVFAHPLPRLSSYHLTVADLNRALVARRPSCSKPTLSVRYIGHVVCCE